MKIIEPQRTFEKTMESRSFEVLDSHKRMEEREANRAANRIKEQELLDARRGRAKRLTADEHVAKAVKKLSGMNVMHTVNFLRTLSSRELDYYLIAESISENRVTVLKQFSTPRKSVVVAFYGTDTPDEAIEDEASNPEASPDESPEDTSPIVEQTEE